MQRPFFLDKVLNLLCGDDSDIGTVCDGSYAGYAALELLFCPDLSQAGNAGQQNNAEPFFVVKIKQAIQVVGTQNPLLKSLF